MFTKVYEKVLEYIKKEYKFLIVLLLVFGLFTFKLPYYIDIPGGAIDITKRIKIDGNNEINGKLNFAYVSEMRATIPTLIIEAINPDWDLLKKEQVVLDNETVLDMRFRDGMLLKEAFSNALYVGFSEAKQDFEVVNNKIFVTSILKEAKTNLKVGDQIVKINDKYINSIKDLKFVNDMNENENVVITVLNDGKEYERRATTIKYDDKVIVGVGINQTFDISSSHEVEVDYNDKESGPSGGMMMALTVYSYLTHDDIVRGKNIVGTGTIDIDGNVGEIGGVKYKLIGAVKKKADVFLVPMGDNYEEAMKVKNDKGYDIKIIPVSTLREAIDSLRELQD